MKSSSNVRIELAYIEMPIGRPDFYGNSFMPDPIVWTEQTTTPPTTLTTPTTTAEATSTGAVTTNITIVEGFNSTAGVSKNALKNERSSKPQVFVGLLAGVVAVATIVICVALIMVKRRK